MKRTAILSLLLALSATPLLAWGEKGHLISNEAATYGVPPQMPTFFHKAYPRLVYLSYEPDRLRGAGEALESVNPPDHFLDYEWTGGLPMNSNRYDFIHEQEKAGRPQKYFISNSTIGFLPWRIAELSDQLTQEWKLWRASTDRVEREQLEDNIVYISGILGHFVADASNPHHTTIDFNGWVEDNPEHYPTDCDTHSRFETQFVSRNMTATMVFPAVKPLQLRDSDYFKTALAFVQQTNGLVETLYRIDRDHGLDGAGSEEARQFTIGRLAAGASLLRDLWYSCYVNSAVTTKKK